MDIMEEPISFYKAQRNHHQSTSKGIFKKMGWFSVLRLLVFGVTIFGIYLTFDSWKLAFIIGIVGTGIFLYLLSQRKRAFASLFCYCCYNKLRYRGLCFW